MLPVRPLNPITQNGILFTSAASFGFIRPLGYFHKVINIAQTMIKRVALLPIILLTFLILPAQTNQVKQLAYADSLRLVSIFKDIHQNPEPAFMEVRTANIVATELKALGLNVFTGIAKTGVIGILKNGDGPVVMFRADMDCNSVKEATGLSYASTKKVKKADGTEAPVMHACGHDAHVTWMLGIAKVMVALKKSWKGTLVFVSQPAEEIGAGAKAMAADSIYKTIVPIPDYLFGMHTWPTPVGTIVNRVNENMSGVDFLDVEFFGTGGHGALPESTKDPVLMVCNAVLQYQTIISRQISATDMAVLTVGSIQTGIDNNVIPSQATAKLSLRWFNQKTRRTILDGIARINEGIAFANGLSKDKYPIITMKTTIDPVINDASITGKINKEVANELPQVEVITNLPPVMMAEDFPYLVKGNNKTVYDFLLVGVANKVEYDLAIGEGKTAPYTNHSGAFKVDLSAIPMGVVIGATALMELLKR